MQGIRNNEWTHHQNEEVEPIQLAHINIYQSNTYRKGLSWLHFHNEPRVQERQSVKDQQSYRPVHVAWLTYTQVAAGSTIPHMVRVFCAGHMENL